MIFRISQKKTTTKTPPYTRKNTRALLGLFSLLVNYSLADPHIQVNTYPAAVTTLRYSHEVSGLLIVLPKHFFSSIAFRPGRRRPAVQRSHSSYSWLFFWKVYFSASDLPSTAAIGYAAKRQLAHDCSSGALQRHIHSAFPLRAPTARRSGSSPR